MQDLLCNTRQARPAIQDQEETLLSCIGKHAMLGTAS
jgi:hypothetical protein